MRHYTNPMDNLSQCRVALQDAHQEIADLKAKLADATRDRDSFRDSFTRILDTVGCQNIFVSDEALAAGIREKMAGHEERHEAEVDKLRAALREIGKVLDRRTIRHSGLCIAQQVGDPCVCGLLEIRAIVERAVGGES